MSEKQASKSAASKLGLEPDTLKIDGGWEQATDIHMDADANIVELRALHSLHVRAMRREIILTLVACALLPFLRRWGPTDLGFCLILVGMLLCFVCLDIAAVISSRRKLRAVAC
jgi:hypothetical protein